MYDYRCEECENLGQCRHMENMPMANMPMMNMPMGNMPMMNMPMMNMPMMNMPMMNMPMMNMPMCDEDDEDDEDLKSMYPKVYIRMYPMVKHHYNMIVAKYGKMYCPSEDEMDHMCKDICDKYKEHHKDDDDDDDCNDDGMRDLSRRDGGGGILGDLARILLIGNLIGGRNYYGF
ncbi:hypothetical protein LGK95_11205 [Clostridium algoriphilum]|uniref:hypothetical protein n=1 Tax=Clostridium algoriphilum TaxID=198347 RepID=UPI001CF105BE|nr:hypothetical protein [Clostridium algoriphilum]MCB2294087.1 hypothetical protein [Clostridium algoriphilum]